MSRISVSSILPLVALAGLAASCAQQSQPSSFYVLSYAQGPGPGGSATTMREGISLAVGPVELPQYLDRPQIVTRSSNYELVLEEFDRWGGRLKENFTTVLAEVLSSELATDRIVMHPWNAPVQVQYQVVVHVTAFDTDQSGHSILDARWSIVDLRRADVLATARSTLREQVAASTDLAALGINHDAIAAAMSRNVAALGREIAKQIESLSSD
jgi:uncharacterized protein